MQALSKAEAGKTYTIKWMFGEPEVLEFLRGYSLDAGSMIQVIRKYAGCLVIGKDKVRLAIGNEVADRIQV